MKLKKITKNKLLMVRALLSIVILGSVLWHFVLAHATYNQNNIMDSGIFDNSGTMTAPQIDAWLNANFPNSCISTNNGFSAPEPTGYTPSTGFTYVGTVSAGAVIYDAAHVYGLNPQVILATLEKESSVITGNASYHCQYINTSMGFDCPDSGSCPQRPATESGFSQQVIHAAWVLKFHEQRSQGNTGWNVQMANFPHPGDFWDNSDDPQSCYSGRMTQGTYAICPSGAAAYYDGLTTIDGTTVHLDTAPTAALYDYTPHFSGNQHFDNIFIGWFGSLYAAPYTAGYFSQSGYLQLNPNQQASSSIEYQNLGTATWYDSQGLGGAPAGTNPVHLATAHSLNRGSAFSAGWPTPSRPTLNFAAVYEPDGTTLAPNQHAVQPGQVGKFSFNFTDPATLQTGTYQEYFQPVVEGSSTQWFNDSGSFFNVTVNASPGIGWNSQSSYPTIAPSDTQSSYMAFANTGNVPLYDDQSIGAAPSGSHPTHLAVECPMNSNSDFAANGWANPSRPATNFAAVFNSDGSTLASNQHVALPGQIIKFAFNFKVPNGYSVGTYKVCLQPVLEGTSGGTYPDMGAYLNLAVPSEAVLGFNGAPASYPMVSGEQQSFSIPVQNVGNAALGSGATVVSGGSSSYMDGSWTSPTTITNAPSLAAGASGTLTFTLLAPTTTSNRADNFTFQLNDSSNNQVHDSTYTMPIQLAAPAYSAGYVSQSPYPAFTSGQSQTVYLRYKNTSNKPWYDDASVSSAVSRNALPTHLATDAPLNRGSLFDYNWPTASRPAAMFSAVYNSDNSTLAGNQHVVQPGQIAQFTFQVASDPGLSPGTYHEYFRPIIEGVADGGIGFQWTFLDMAFSAPQYNATFYSESSFPTLSAGQSTAAFLEYKNTGSVAWYDDTSYSSAPGRGGLYPVHLATSHNLNRSSNFSSGWPTNSRSSLNFGAVYESDGTTLAANQHVVQPGQIAKFSFNLTNPSSGSASGTYREFFQPIAEGSMFGEFNDPWTSLVVTAQ